LIFHCIIVGVPAAPDAEVGLRAEHVFPADQLFKRGGG
jgi:hypothetical protein